MSGNRRRYVRMLCFLLGGVFSSGSHAHPSTDPNLIHLVAYPDPPYMMTDGSQHEGLVIDVAALMFKRAGRKFHLTFMPPKRALQTAVDNYNHCVLAVERSQERETNYQWVSPLVISRHAFYRRADSPIRLHSLSDARPFLIGSYLGSGAGEYLESQGFRVDSIVDNSLNLLKLDVRRIDLWATDTVSYSWQEQSSTKKAELEMVFLTTLRSMACHRSMPVEWIRDLQKELVGMYRDGSIDLIYEKYVPNSAQWLLNGRP